MEWTQANMLTALGRQHDVFANESCEIRQLANSVYVGLVKHDACEVMAA